MSPLKIALLFTFVLLLIMACAEEPTRPYWEAHAVPSKPAVDPCANVERKMFKTTYVRHGSGWVECKW